MVTREVLKNEIDCIQDEYLDVLHRFIKSLEMSLKELRGVTGARTVETNDMPHARKQKFLTFGEAHRQQPTIRQLLEELRNITTQETFEIEIPARQDRLSPRNQANPKKNKKQRKRIT